MTIEFPDEPGVDVAAPAGPPPVPVDRRARLRSALPWTVPTVLAAVALTLPATTTRSVGQPGALAGLADSFRFESSPFGRVRLHGTDADPGFSGPAYGWVWLVLAVGFAAVAVTLALGAGIRVAPVLGAVVGAVGIGSVATVAVDSSAAGGTLSTELGPGAWLTLAAGVTGVACGLLAIGRSRTAAIVAPANGQSKSGRSGSGQSGSGQSGSGRSGSGQSGSGPAGSGQSASANAGG